MVFTDVGRKVRSKSHQKGLTMPGSVPEAVTDSVSRLEKIQEALHRISDAGQLPLTACESYALGQCLSAVDKCLHVADLLLQTELNRWGL